MTEYEQHKALLADLLSKASPSNAHAIVEGIDTMIDVRLAELLEEMSDRLEALKPTSDSRPARR